MRHLPTPSQTVGPFFHVGIRGEPGPHLVSVTDPDAVRVFGVVFDGASEPVPDALLEIWQANRAGRYAHPADQPSAPPLERSFTGFGRCATDAEGRFEFVTVKPGAVAAGAKTKQAPHIVVGVFARGLLKRLTTRIYFPDEAAANAADSVLMSVRDEDRRRTLVARSDPNGLRFDIHLQGQEETVFFEV
jgi:protocatechuate 3,4-dioxygenase alpha subunit